MEREYRKALKTCLIRYRGMSVNDRDIEEFIDLFESVVDEHPLLKLCRWLGYIQGVLIERGRTTVEKERDWTRPLFRPIDFEE
jgi:hypothetical protein